MKFLERHLFRNHRYGYYLRPIVGDSPQLSISGHYFLLLL